MNYEEAWDKTGAAYIKSIYIQTNSSEDECLENEHGWIMWYGTHTACAMCKAHEYALRRHDFPCSNCPLNAEDEFTATTAGCVEATYNELKDYLYTRGKDKIKYNKQTFLYLLNQRFEFLKETYERSF